MTMPRACRECGCNCSLCESNSLDWHHMIEELKAKLVEVSSRASVTERELADSRCRADVDIARLQDELLKLRDRYDRLLESHKKLQKLNHELEDKLITVVSKLESEKLEMTGSLCSMQQKLTELETVVQELEDERDQLKTDCVLAVQLLHCRPSDFIAYKLNELPLTLQERVRGQLTPKELMALDDVSGHFAAESSSTSINIPIPTFPPTAAVCVVRPPPMPSTDGPLLPRVNTVPMSLVAQALLPPEDDWSPRRRRGDSYVCSVCRRCDSAVEGSSRPAVLQVTEEQHSFQTNPGIHVARKSPTHPNITLTRS